MLKNNNNRDYYIVRSFRKKKKSLKNRINDSLDGPLRGVGGGTIS